MKWYFRFFIARTGEIDAERIAGFVFMAYVEISVSDGQFALTKQMPGYGYLKTPFKIVIVSEQFLVVLVGEWEAITKVVFRV